MDAAVIFLANVLVCIIIFLMVRKSSKSVTQGIGALKDFLQKRDGNFGIVDSAAIFTVFFLKCELHLLTGGWLFSC